MISSASLEDLNNFFKYELSFIQTSLNKINNNFDTSSGKIIRENDNSLKIEVDEPFKERYLIDNNGIKIYDLEFDQVRMIEKEEINNDILEFIYSGFSNDLDIENLNDKSFKIIEDNNSYYIEFVNKQTLQIKYKDNMGVENLVRFFKQ
jgi:outer membrane lipoprotein-sorting protein|tara:strand:- start:303 stop:749 length:447 start_codon:yes stop_codon:yes gene_type:complete